MATDKKFADAVTIAFGKPKKGSAKAMEGEDDEEGSAAEEAGESDEEEKGEEEEKPGRLGKVAIAAIREGDGEAFEEAVRKICGDY